MIVILNAGAGKVAKAGNLQSMIAGLFAAEGLNAEIILVAGKDVSASKPCVGDAAQPDVSDSDFELLASGLHLPVPSFHENVRTILPKPTLDSIRSCASR